MANNKHFKMKEFIRFHSVGVYITPLDEIEAIEKQKRLEAEAELKRAKRKSYRRKSKQKAAANASSGQETNDAKSSEPESSTETETDIKQSDASNEIKNTDGTKKEGESKTAEVSSEDVTMKYTSEQTEGPSDAITTDENKEKSNTNQDVENENESIEKPDESQKTTEDAKLEGQDSEADDHETSTSSEKTPSDHDKGKGTVSADDSTTKDADGDVKMKTEETEVDSVAKEQTVDTPQSDESASKTEINIKQEEESISTEDVPEEKSGKEVQPEESKSEKTENITEEATSNDASESKKTDNDDTQADISVKVEVQHEKRVKFADDVIDSSNSRQTTAEPLASTEEEGSVPPEDEIEEVKPIYEGPPQYVARNLISLEEFSTQLNVKKLLLGEQSLLPGSHRDPHAQNICIIKRDLQGDINLKKMRNSRDRAFQKLLRLPRFGEDYQIVEDSKAEKTEEEIKIQITTPAPLGIYLPNGNKKKCLIDGGKATYYDPSNGVPYNSVEGFKVLKKLADGGFYWNQIDAGGINSKYRGGIGCYFGEVDGRHAKGVPEGF
ncbi:unnamed protein product [Ambrosiozyma monospora]|uniref:Unnamed protein product n=1 Tax=Ambrosiozyma monospora TaxID=43982 RepID=A0ACB5T293_AMBMO|nr:unnamed protein product [Ambrosiozyma monospora]